jgi:hypothetical protein
VRTIRYASKSAVAGGISIQSKRGATKDGDVDGYLERLTKYVPVEVLAAYLLLSEITKDRDLFVVVFLVCCLVLVPAYLWVTRVVKPAADQPKFRPIMYFLGPISFAIWALNSGDALLDWLASIEQPVVLVDRPFAIVVLVFGALLIPFIDIVWDYWRARSE